MANDLRLFGILAFSLLTFPALSQKNNMAAVDSQLTGTWKGTSLCQIKNSPCHDETVVYHIYKKTAKDTFYIQANKIVNGVEDDMGILPCTFDYQTNHLISTAYGNWSWLLTNDVLEGTLYVRGNLYRKIKLKKQP